MRDCENILTDDYGNVVGGMCLHKIHAQLLCKRLQLQRILSPAVREERIPREDLIHGQIQMPKSCPRDKSYPLSVVFDTVKISGRRR